MQLGVERSRVQVPAARLKNANQRGSSSRLPDQSGASPCSTRWIASDTAGHKSASGRHWPSMSPAFERCETAPGRHLRAPLVRRQPGLDWDSRERRFPSNAQFTIPPTLQERYGQPELGDDPCRGCRAGHRAQYYPHRDVRRRNTEAMRAKTMAATPHTARRMPVVKARGR